MTSINPLLLPLSFLPQDETKSQSITHYTPVTKDQRASLGSGIYLFEKENEMYIKGAKSSKVTNEGNVLFLEGELDNGQKFKIRYDKPLNRVTVIGSDSNTVDTKNKQAHEVDINQEYNLPAYSLNGGDNISDNLLVKNSPWGMKISVQGDYDTSPVGTVQKDSVTLPDSFSGSITLVSGNKENKKFPSTAFPNLSIGNSIVFSDDTNILAETTLPGDKQTYNFSFSEQPGLLTTTKNYLSLNSFDPNNEGLIKFFQDNPNSPLFDRVLAHSDFDTNKDWVKNLVTEYPDSYMADKLAQSEKLDPTSSWVIDLVKNNPDSKFAISLVKNPNFDSKASVVKNIVSKHENSEFAKAVNQIVPEPPKESMFQTFLNKASAWSDYVSDTAQSLWGRTYNFFSQTYDKYFGE